MVQFTRGRGAPPAAHGAAGDVYFDIESWTAYGPRPGGAAGRSWGRPRTLWPVSGPARAPLRAAAAGVLGAVAAAAGVAAGKDPDQAVTLFQRGEGWPGRDAARGTVYLDVAGWRAFGPKRTPSGGAWPAPRAVAAADVPPVAPPDPADDAPLADGIGRALATDRGEALAGDLRP